MLELVKFIVTELVDDKAAVEVKQQDEKRITISVAQSDMGKIIGRGGKIAKAIRIVARASAPKTDDKIFIDILESDEKVAEKDSVSAPVQEQVATE